MKTIVLTAVLSMTVIGLGACDARRGDTNSRGVSESTHTQVAPSANPSTDPNAAIDQSMRSTDPYATPATPIGGGTADPGRVDEADAREYPADNAAPARNPPSDP